MNTVKRSILNLFLLGLFGIYLTNCSATNFDFSNIKGLKQTDHPCGKALSEIKYQYAPPYDSASDSVGISEIQADSRLLVSAYFNQELRRRYRIVEGYYTSNDGGRTWRLFEPFESDLLDQIRRLFPKDTIDAPSDNQIRYRKQLSKREGPKKDLIYAYIERSTDGGKRWRSMPTLVAGSPVHYINYIWIHPHKPFTLFLRAAQYLNNSSHDSEYGLYVSEDGGQTLRLLGKGMGLQVLAINPSHPNILYTDNYEGHLLKSMDSGKTWRPVGQSDILRTRFTLEHQRLSEEDIARRGPNRYKSIVIDPQDPGVVYVVSEKGLFKTTDGGDHWRILDLGIENARAFNNLVLAPDNHNILYAGTIYGLFKSTDQGCTWEKIEIHKRLIR